MKRFSSAAIAAATFAIAAPAWADKIVILPFTSPNNVAKPDLEEARRWTRDGAAKAGHSFATDAEMVSVMAAIKDGVADISQEYLVAGRTAGADWTLTGHVERRDHPPGRLPDGSEEEGYTTYRVELEACQVKTGRVESLSREVLADDAANDLKEVIAILVRPAGIANADIPWERAGVKPIARKKPPPAKPPPAEPVHMDEAKPKMRVVYGSGHPLALGASIGVTNALSRPSVARGPSWAMPVGGALGYALPESVPGLELRAQITGQVVGPSSLEASGGARWALAPIPALPIFLGPELLLGAHVALGADKTARFLLHGAAFLAIGLTDNVQLEIAGDLMPAFGGSGTLLLGGGTARFVVRF